MHRTIRYDDKTDTMTLTGDTKHVRTLSSELGFNERARSVVSPGVKIPCTDENSTPLEPQEASRYRSLCMTLGYLAQDRPDVQYCGKECARGMSTPTIRHQEILKRTVRYLIGRPSCSYIYKRQRLPNRVSIYSDADWAGCPVTKKSTSGTMVFLGEHLIFSQSSTQTPIALSSGEVNSMHW